MKLYCPNTAAVKRPSCCLNFTLYSQVAKNAIEATPKTMATCATVVLSSEDERAEALQKQKPKVLMGDETRHYEKITMIYV